MTTACQKIENCFQELVSVGRHKFHVLETKIYVIDACGEINRLALAAVLHWESLDHFQELLG
jgi:hypothetical protein